MSQQTVSRIERDKLDGLTVGSLRNCVRVLGGFVAIEVRWHGGALEALSDERHAAIQNWTVGLLVEHGWDARVELSFNHFGDRGRYDVIAFHVPARLLVAIEVKTTIDDAQAMLGRLDVKARVAARVATDLGWHPVAVVPVLIVAEGRTAQRRVAQHPSLFQRYALRGMPALAWLRNPKHPSPSGLLVFVRPPNTRAASTRPRESRFNRRLPAP